MDIICLMHDSQKRGVLRSKTGAFSVQKISKSIAGCKPKMILELIDHGVIKIARKDGALYSKRIVRDELRRRHKSQNGKIGGKQKASKRLANCVANQGSSVSVSVSPSGNNILSVFDPPSFQEFTEVYPLDCDDSVSREWAKQSEEFYAAIIQGAKEWSAYWDNENTEAKWIKSPANFIGNGVWKTRPPARDVDKSCVNCKAPYVVGGHKFLEKDGVKLYKCLECRRKSNVKQEQAEN